MKYTWSVLHRVGSEEPLCVATLPINDEQFLDQHSALFVTFCRDSPDSSAKILERLELPMRNPRKKGTSIVRQGQELDVEELAAQMQPNEARCTMSSRRDVYYHHGNLSKPQQPHVLQSVSLGYVPTSFPID